MHNCKMETKDVRERFFSASILFFVDNDNLSIFKNQKNGMKNISIFKKILIVFVAVGLTAIVADSLIADYIFRKTIIENTDRHFLNNLEKEEHEIEKYFERTKRKIETISKYFAVQKLFGILNNYHTEVNENFPVKSGKYKELTKEYFDYFSEYTFENDYFDMFFICAEHDM